MLLIVAVILLAAVVGFAAQRYLLNRSTHDDPRMGIERLPINELILSVRTLAGLLLAFVLFSVYASYDGAGNQAAAEAGAVLSMAENAVLLTPEARNDVLGAIRCYVRSVTGPDWGAQARDGRPSPIADAAADNITATLAQAAEDERNSAVIGTILGENGDRIQARIERADEARAAVPGVVWALMLITVAISLAGPAALGHPGVRTRVQVAVLVGTTVVSGFTLLVIHDLDRPYDGLAAIGPTAMLNVERRITDLPGGDTDPPCDEQGRLH
ncbi:hypothetical protein DQ238_21025 [Geodermatophilus sp. TF02-6]|uniref:bestrophin-like domain n=1 Tax=Geodermatophilus sp. TF02-6 TaxID=2250575 RepID=UPI000DE98CC9|nr:DUF4239 domain-containing protein [Geodermatophilus sp. TF02-6]RBY74907.1 hypothetical protein DQ238_21025 [Geodermatophilus sp. TF02-6]